MTIKYKDYKYYYLLVIAIIAISISYIYLFKLIQKPHKQEDSITIVGSSMTPTFKDGDEIKYLSSFNQEDITNGTVVIFSNPDDPKTFSIKRVVGVEGSLIEIKDNILYLDKEKVELDKYDTNTSYYIHDMSKFIERDEVFVIGDNYNESKDSRNYGSIPLTSIRGIVKE